MSAVGSNLYIDDLMNFAEATISNEKSEIAEFFAHTNILITGGTGFLGSLVIEKLLRCCPSITKLYMIVRPKKGKTASDRYKENFGEVIYDKLRHEQPNFLQKVVMLEGDATKEDYGLSPEDKNALMDVNIIFHAAAVVRFNEKLRNAININVKSTKFLLLFAKKLPNLKAFVHVSTAFSHCIDKNIDEIHYTDVIDADKVLALLDILDDEKFEQIETVLLGKWPNTYIFSKALGENVVLKYSSDLPVCIVRPSIVIATFKEPISAWINNIYGPTGIIVGCGLGLLRTMYCKEECVADIIPADYVISNVISSAWDVANRKAAIKSDQVSNLTNEEKIPIYNSVSSCQNPITWGEFIEKNKAYALEVPSMKLPGVIVDTLLYLTGRKPILLNTYNKIHKLIGVIHYFSTSEWDFKNDNVIKLWNKMNSVDQEIFCVNVQNMDWDEYIFQLPKGIRTYLVKDPMDTVEAARKRYRKLRLAHYSVILIIILITLWIAISFISFFW